MDAPRPLAHEFDLVDVRDPEKPFGVRQDLGLRELWGCDHQNGGVDVRVLVVEDGPAQVGREAAADVARLLAHLVPEARHELRRRVVPQDPCTTATPGRE
jgi:hypothetical protein